MDGQYCTEFQITPKAAEPGQEPVTLTSHQACLDVNAPACEVDMLAAIGTSGMTNYVRSYFNMAEWAGNVWCQPDAVSFDWQIKYFNQDWQDEAVDGVPYKDALAVNYTVIDEWSEPDSDYSVDVKFTIDYAPTTYVTQQDAETLSWTITDSMDIVQTCRPKFAFDPSIDSVELQADGTLDINVLWQTNTSGFHNCTGLFANFEVFNADTQESISNYSMPADDVPNYQTVQPAYALGNLEEQCTCFQVKITYGEDHKSSSVIQGATDTTCYCPVCELSDAKITNKSRSVSDDGETVSWEFEIDVTENKWCYDLSSEVCLEEPTSGAKYCSEVADQAEIVLQFTDTVKVVQKGSFNADEMKAIVTYSGSNDTTLSAEVYPLDNKPPGPEWCNFAYSTDLTFWKDTLNKVWINQTASGSANSVCGAPYVRFKNNANGDETDWIENVLKHDWTLASETGTYSFTTYFEFANFMGYVFSDGGVSGRWIQGCEVLLDQVEFDAFTIANNETNTDAAANLFANGSMIGDCGNDFTVTGLLTGTDGSSYPIDINHADFFSAKGQHISQAISREAVNYTFSVTVTADNAQSVEAHQAMTVSEGYNNVLSDTANTTAPYGGPVCNVYIHDVEWVSYEEETDWTGPMLATYRGQISAEVACDEVRAVMKIKSPDGSSYIN